MKDGAIYAAAPVKNDADWAMVLKDPHEQKILQGGGVTEKVIAIDEAVQLKSFMDNLNVPTGGVWFGGIKYTVSHVMAEEELGEQKHKHNKQKTLLEMGAYLVGVSCLDEDAIYAVDALCGLPPAVGLPLATAVEVAVTELEPLTQLMKDVLSAEINKT